MYSPFDVDEDMDTSPSPPRQSYTATTTATPTPQQSVVSTQSAYNTGGNAFPVYNNYFGGYPNSFYPTAQYPQYNTGGTTTMRTQPTTAWTTGMIPPSVYQAPQTTPQYHSVPLTHLQQQKSAQVQQQQAFQSAYSNYVPSGPIDSKKKISFNITLQKDIKPKPKTQSTSLHPNAGATEVIQLEKTPAPPPPPPPTPTYTPSSASDYPASLKAYVQRTFEKYSTPEYKREADAVLRTMITEAINKNELYSTDWNQKELPVLKPAAPVVKQPFINKKQQQQQNSKFNNKSNTMYDHLNNSNNNNGTTMSGYKHDNDSSSSSNNNNTYNQMNQNGGFYSKYNNNNISSNNYNYHNYNNEDNENNNGEDEGKGKKKKRKRNNNNNNSNGALNNSALASSSSNSLEFGNIDHDPYQQQKRLKRFESDLPTSQPDLISFRNNNNPGDLRIKGICTDLEKSYYRLLSEPDPRTIRPEEVLVKSLELIKEKWITKSADYIYLCDQLKAVRQDLTIQRIENELTVDVYETHARIALENRDISEFNQCQSRLKTLYEDRSKEWPNEMEFIAYRLLYSIKNADKDSSSMMAALQNLSAEDMKDFGIQHALMVRKCVALKNYHQFFKTYKKSPKWGKYLINQYVTPLRNLGVKTICKSFRPFVSLEFVQKELDFESLEECRSFLQMRGGIIEGNNFMTQKSENRLSI